MTFQTQGQAVLGGALYLGDTADRKLHPLLARFYVYEPTVTRDAILPANVNIDDTGLLFYVLNDGPGSLRLVEEDDSEVVATLAAGKLGIVFRVFNSPPILNIEGEPVRKVWRVQTKDVLF